MSRCVVTRGVPGLIGVAALLCLFGAFAGEVSIRVEIDRDITGDPGSRARDRVSAACESSAIADVLSKLRGMRMRSS